jgi:hypothetical protein
MLDDFETADIETGEKYLRALVRLRTATLIAPRLSSNPPDVAGGGGGGLHPVEIIRNIHPTPYAVPAVELRRRLRALDRRQ